MIEMIIIICIKHYLIYPVCKLPQTHACRRRPIPNVLHQFIDKLHFLHAAAALNSSCKTHHRLERRGNFSQLVTDVEMEGGLCIYVYTSRYLPGFSFCPQNKNIKKHRNGLRSTIWPYVKLKHQAYAPQNVTGHWCRNCALGCKVMIPHNSVLPHRPIGRAHVWCLSHRILCSSFRWDKHRLLFLIIDQQYSVLHQ